MWDDPHASSYDVIPAKAGTHDKTARSSVLARIET